MMSVTGLTVEMMMLTMPPQHTMMTVLLLFVTSDALLLFIPTNLRHRDYPSMLSHHGECRRNLRRHRTMMLWHMMIKDQQLTKKLQSKKGRLSMSPKNTDRKEVNGSCKKAVVGYHLGGKLIYFTTKFASSLLGKQWTVRNLYTWRIFHEDESSVITGCERHRKIVFANFHTIMLCSFVGGARCIDTAIDRIVAKLDDTSSRFSNVKLDNVILGNGIPTITTHKLSYRNDIKTYKWT